MVFESAARTDIGRRRKLNEDALLCRPDLGLWAVADGMGGHDCGEVASALVIERLAAALTRAPLPDRILAARLALSDTNQDLIQMAAQGDPPRTIGSTVVMLAADSKNYACLWAGDSRAYRARGGALQQLSRDHSLVQQLVDVGELDPTEAIHHPNANVITRAVGAAPELALELVQGELEAGDIYLLASDGLTRLVNDRELLAALGGADLPDVADELIALALERGAPDNVTLVLIRT